MTGIRVVVGDQSPIYGDGLVAFLRGCGGVEVVARATHPAEVANLAEELKPDVVIAAFDPLAVSLALVRDLRPTPVLVLGWATEGPDVLEAIRARAHGYLPKQEAPATLLYALIELSKGRTVYPHGWQQDILDLVEHNAGGGRPSPTLTPREHDIVEQVVSGRSNKEIARALDLAPQTVKNHLTHIMMKARVSSRIQLYRWALETGVVQTASAGGSKGRA